MGYDMNICGKDVSIDYELMLYKEAFLSARWITCNFIVNK